MGKFKKVLAVAILLGVALTGGWLSRCSAAEQPGEVKVEQGISITLGPVLRFMNSNVHQQRYLTYLVKEYDPDSLPAWEKAFAEHNEAQKKLLQKIEVKKVDTVTLKPAVSLGENANDSQNQAMIPGGALSFTLPDGPIPDEDKEIQEQNELLDSFEKAVEHNDKAALKEILPKVLDMYRQFTDDISNGSISVSTPDNK